MKPQFGFNMLYAHFNFERRNSSFSDHFRISISISLYINYQLLIFVKYHNDNDVILYDNLTALYCVIMTFIERGLTDRK